MNTILVDRVRRDDVLFQGNPNTMEAAYVFSIIIAMMMTTALMFGYMKFVRKWNMVLILLSLSGYSFYGGNGFFYCQYCQDQTKMDVFIF